MLSEFDLRRMESPDVSDAGLVAGMVQDTLDELDLSPPIDHDLVASYRNVARIEQANIPWAGHIARTGEALVIGVRAADTYGRQRFTIFHEVLHTYMRGFHLAQQYRCHPGSEPAGVQRDRGLEDLCDRGAADMLMPREHFLDDLAGNAVDLDLIDRLARRYEASRTAIGARICALNPVKTAYLTLELARKPRDPAGEPQLRVQSCIGGAGWAFIPKHKSASPGGVFDRAFQGEIVEEIAYLDELARHPLGWVHVSARRADYIDSDGEEHMRVRALLTQRASVGHRSRG